MYDCDLDRRYGIVEIGNVFCVAVEDSENWDDSKAVKQHKLDCELIFSVRDYNRLWGRDIDADALCQSLAQCVCDTLNESGCGASNPDYDDVRYRVYWHNKKNKFVSTCVQDFDIDDYVVDNFVCIGGEAIEFERYYYSNFGGMSYDSDDLCEKLADIVCGVLNEAVVIGSAESKDRFAKLKESICKAIDNIPDSAEVVDCYVEHSYAASEAWIKIKIESDSCNRDELSEFHDVAHNAFNSDLGFIS